MKILSLDIGGTGVQYCLYDANTKEFGEIQSISTRNINKDELMIKIAKIADKLKPNIISASSPGAIINNEYVSGLTGIKDYSNFNFANELRSLVANKDITIKLLNDANAALMSEIDETNSHLDMALISIGTGIGGAISLAGKIRTGNKGMAGEFGYQIVDDKRNVSLASSSRSIETAFKNKFNESRTAKDILELYNADKRCKEVIDLAVKQNAINIFNLYYTLDIDIFIISGGISRSKFFISEIKRVTQELVDTRGAQEPIKIKPAKHTNMSGLIGAVNFALI
ncbi:ROK family protein [Mycoplasma todarodis]|uniref:ROK family protein n=1 Tax=Mycoplasma todarodis TaxID=1937191 RepID=UPI003B507520